MQVLHLIFEFILTSEQYGDYVVNGSYLRGVTPYDGIKAASDGGTFN